VNKIKNIKNFIDNDFIEDFTNASEKELSIDKNITSKFMKRIYKEAVRKKPILVAGDYDPDGLNGSLILCNYIKLLESRVNGIKVDDSNVETYYTKREHGYTMPKEIFDSLSEKYSLIVFVDTGSSYEYFNESTKNVLVIDHHPTSKESLPFVYNPSRNNEVSTSAGKVVYDMTMAFEEEMKEYFGKKKIKPHDVLKLNKMLAGISLCADMAEMSFENKQFLKESLEIMTENRNKLTWISSIRSKNITSLDLSFNIINKINSYSRMGKDLKEIEGIFKVSIDSKNLRHQSSSAKVKKLFDELDFVHEERKRVTATLEKKIDKVLSSEYVADKSLFVLKVDNSYSGINGLLSQNVLNKTMKSNIVISYDNNRKCYVGSGRGNVVKDALQEFLDTNKELEKHIKFGGHMMAIGVTIDSSAIDEFMSKINSFPFSEKIQKRAQDSNERFYYCDGVSDFKEAVSHYNTLSPTTNIQERYYAIVENYKNLGIVEKNNGWLCSTIKDSQACINIYFKNEDAQMVSANHPIVLEITNQDKGNYFIQHKQYNSLLLNECKEQRDVGGEYEDIEPDSDLSIESLISR
jgi:single-stranded DNA-specific DHH superfamily exonuclease